MTCQIGDFDIENKLGHPVRYKRVGTDYLNITGDWTKGEGGGINFIQSLTDEFNYAGRYARFVIPGASADTVQDLSPDSSVLRYVSCGTTSNYISDWYAVDDFNYNVSPGRPDQFTFWLRLTKVRQ
jgi:hypothetical protein